MKLDRRRWTGLALVALLTAVVVLRWFPRDTRQQRYIAYVGRFDSTNPGFDSLHVAVLRQYLAELNRSIPLVRFELATFSNANDPKVSDSLYRTVLKDPKYALVLDNTWSAHLQPSAQTIRQNRIPVLAINADKGTADSARYAVFF